MNCTTLFRRGAVMTILLLVLCTAGLAASEQADVRVLSTEVYCFAQTDFSENALDGVVLTQLPEQAVGTVRYGTRALCCGDVLPAAALDQLTLEPASGNCEALVCFLPVANRTVGQELALKIAIGSGKDEAPTAQETELETYRNVALSGTVGGEDPEGQALTYALVDQPRRGTVELQADGSFVYTPENNKVGRDSFTFTAADPAGNVSEKARVSIQIKRPADKTTYADMAGDPDEFAALWLREQKVFYGQSLGNVSVFEPEQTVTRGEFLVMTMDALGIQPDTQGLTTGFADEQSTPEWMRPYVAAAFRAGIISGVQSEEGLVFRPDAALTRAEAAVMLGSLLGLPDSETQTVSAMEDALPAWAAADITALAQANILEVGEPSAVLTRRDAARALYRASTLLETSAYAGSLLAWAAR